MIDQRNHNRILHGIEMPIMNISIPQQDIGVRVSLPLESHHVDGNSFAHKTNVVEKKQKTREEAIRALRIGRCIDQRNHNRILHGIVMLIMNISTPQQNIGVRVSLPLESHHIRNLPEVFKSGDEGCRSEMRQVKDSSYLPSKSCEFTKNSMNPGRLSP